MTKREMKRIALATEAYYILVGNQTDCITDEMSEKDSIKFLQVQRELAFSWLRQAGLSERPASVAEIFEVILGRKP
jgi:hypothetical protein